MLFLLWLYLANLSNRIRVASAMLFELFLITLALEYLMLATHQRPAYFALVNHYIGWTKIILLCLWFLVLFPSKSCLLNILSLKKKDLFLRNSLLTRIIRLLKLRLRSYFSKNNLSDQSLYLKLVTPARINLLASGLYLYDLYQVYSRLWRALLYLLAAYFAFICASWIYLHLTGASLYYSHLIDISIDWSFAVIGFIIFKLIFLPDFSTLKSVLIRLAVSALLHKLGIIRMASELEAKLAKTFPGEV